MCSIPMQALHTHGVYRTIDYSIVQLTWSAGLILSIHDNMCRGLVGVYAIVLYLLVQQVINISINNQNHLRMRSVWKNMDT